MSNITLTLSLEDPVIARQIIDLVGGSNTAQELKRQMVAQAPVQQFSPYAPAPAPAPVTANAFAPPAPVAVPTAPVNPPIAAPTTISQPVGAANTPLAAMPAPTLPAPTATPSNAAPVAAAPTYTVEDLGRAGSSLVDTGKQQQVLALFDQFGIHSLGELPAQRYGEFATALRQLGARI